MRRQSLVTGVALATLLAGLSACGGSDDKADPKPTKTTASPTPTTPVQPKGAYGVTYEIQNWDQYANDPAVLAWKQTLEAAAGSINAGKINAPMREGMNKKVLRDFTANAQTAWKKKWHLKDVGNAKIISSSVTGSRASVAACLWDPSTVFYQKNGKVYGDVKNQWSRQKVGMDRSADRWVITSFAYDGTCEGGPPA